MIVRIAVIGLLALILAVGGTVSWLNMGGEARKDWFWCDLIDWCEAKKLPQHFLDRDLTPPPVKFRPERRT